MILVDLGLSNCVRNLPDGIRKFLDGIGKVSGGCQVVSGKYHKNDLLTRPVVVGAFLQISLSFINYLNELLILCKTRRGRSC